MFMELLIINEKSIFILAYYKYNYIFMSFLSKTQNITISWS